MKWFENWLVNRALHIKAANAASIDKKLGLRPGTTAAADALLTGVVMGAITPTLEHAAPVAALAALAPLYLTPQAGGKE